MQKCKDTRPMPNEFYSSKTTLIMTIGSVAWKLVDYFQSLSGKVSM